FYSSPWTGGWWRLGDAVRYMLGASMAVLDTTAKYRESLLYNRYQAARDNITRFRKEPPFAYVIPQEQHDLPTAATLVEKLLINRHRGSSACRIFGRNGPRVWGGVGGHLDGPALRSVGQGALRAAALSGFARGAERASDSSIRRGRLDTADADGRGNRRRAAACQRRSARRIAPPRTSRAGAGRCPGKWFRLRDQSPNERLIQSDQRGAFGRRQGGLRGGK